MQVIDWLIVAGLFAVLAGVLWQCQRHVRNAADFLAANRCAGRYLLCITSGIAGIGAISIIATFEQYYVAGFSPNWWGFISGPIGLLITISGWIFYRLRETRCLTLAQFFEVRYSRNFRIFSGLLCWFSGVLNYGIFPAVSVKFFIYFCRLPAEFRLPGLPFVFSTYVCLLLLAIGLGLLFATSGGQIAIMMTDFIQGIFCNVAFLILMVYLVQRFSWGTIFETLTAHAEAHPGESLFNPYETTSIRDFNIWYFIVGIVNGLKDQCTWQGSSGYSAAALSPHESKMAGFLGTWRGLVQASLLLFIPICAFVFFNHPGYAGAAAEVNGTLSGLAGTDVSQARVPLFLAYNLPVGLLGLFAAVMFAAMLSTDDTYLHSWGTIFIQDVVMPIRRKPFTPRAHLRALRASIAFVALFAFFFSWLFKQTEYIFLFFQITGAIFTGGAGAVIIGGLYSKGGTTLAAWLTMALGSFFALSGIAVQQAWNPYIVQWLEGLLAANPEAMAWLQANAERFPVNGQMMAFAITIFGFVCYFGVSWLDRRLRRRPYFNLRKMLHRGEYDVAKEHEEKWSSGKLWRLLGLTSEFSFTDRLLFFASLLWTLLWTGCFFAGTIGHVMHLWQPIHWLKLWKFHVMVGFVLGIGTTLWFLVCGFTDIRKLFRLLATKKRNDEDDGRVVDGRNAGE